jgi:hypothetical protein
MSRSLSALVAAVAVVATAGCGYEHSTNTLAPTSIDGSRPTNNSPTATGPLVGIWRSNELPSVPTIGRCGNFQFQISSQTATAIAGTFTGICGGGLTIAGTANGRVEGNNVPVTITGAANGPGLPNCPFTITGNGTLEDGGNTLRIPYSGTTCLGPVNGTEVLRKPQPATDPVPPPAPTPEPPPPPPPAPAPTSDDAIDIHQVTVVGSADVRDWPATARIHVLDFNSSGVAIDFTKKEGAGRWPDVVPNGWDGPIQYTVWMVVNHGGRWYTAGGVEFWHGLGRSGGPPSQFANNWYYNPQIWAPLTYHQPGVGEQVGFFVTAGDQRAKDVHIVAERSNIVMLAFPSDGGGYYPF